MVTALDAMCARELVDAGFDPGAVALTGQPYFARLLEQTPVAIPAPRLPRRVLFASQPMPGEGPALVKIARACVVLRSDFARFSVRLHPRATNKDEIFALLRSFGLPVEIDVRSDLAASLAEHDVVLGMNSALLIEAALAGARVGRVRGAEYDLPASLDPLVCPLDSVDEIVAFLREPSLLPGDSDFFINHRGADRRIALLAQAMMRESSVRLNAAPANLAFDRAAGAPGFTLPPDLPDGIPRRKRERKSEPSCSGARLGSDGGAERGREIG